jgi:hypothetical protein
VGLLAVLKAKTRRILPYFLKDKLQKWGRWDLNAVYSGDIFRKSFFLKVDDDL